MSITLQTKSSDVMSLKMISVTDKITDIEIKLKFPQPIVPEKTKIKWYTNAAGSCMVWSPLEVYVHEIRPNWHKSETVSRSACGMPMQCYISAGGENVVMVSVSDVQTPMTIRSGVIEETGELEWEVVLFSERTEQMTEYSAVLRIDERKIPYEEMIGETAQRWQMEYKVKKNMYAFEPVYSTWYSYHQQLSPKLTEELKAAAKLGMKTVIIDDGWQTDDNSRGYAHCGDWRVAKSKIPDMKAFIDEVHTIGMKVMLWYSVPFVGRYSKVWERFSDYTLYDTNGEYGTLDPRYPQVREYLVSVYEQAVKEWGLDGLKLDFIDWFMLEEQSRISHPDMDMLSVEKAVRTLLEEIHTKLTAINPDILIEFRQKYVGPVMLTYGNMFRAADCPMDALTNRIRTVNLRLTSESAVVHSDMLMWDYKDSVLSAANQFINILFSVPQISVRINELPDEHYEMLMFYMKLWISNRETITEGTIHALHPEANYTLVYACKDNRIVAAAYGDKILCLDRQINQAVFVNGTGTDSLYIESEDNKYTFDIYNCMGQLTESGIIKTSVTKINVPVSGVVILNIV